MYGQQPQKIKPVPKATPAPEDDREVDLDGWDDIVADRYKVPRSLMKSVRAQESGGNDNAVSPTGVRGRYQVTEATAKQYGLDRNDPWQQSVAAAKHLRAQYDSLKDVTDDDEKWLGAVGKYYGGNDAVKGGVLSGSSIDGVSNPAEHVRKVAEKWGQFRKSEQSSAPAPFSKLIEKGYGTAEDYPTPARVPSLAGNPNAKQSPVGYFDTSSVNDPNSPVGGPMAWQGTDTDASGRETGAGMVIYKPAGVAPRPRQIDPRARQAAQVARKINEQRNEATRLFKQADSTPMERMGGAFNNQQQLRAQAEGKLEQANMLAKNAQQDFGDMLEVGFGKDADPNSKRQWAYAKPKAPKAMEESDALAIQAGNNRRFADPNGLNQALNVTPEAKARFDRQRRVEAMRGTASLDPVSRAGSRIAGMLGGAPLDEVQEAIPSIYGAPEAAANEFMSSAIRGASSMPEGLARIADRQLNSGELARANALQKMMAAHPEWTPEQRAQVTAQVNQIYANQYAMGDKMQGITNAGAKLAGAAVPTDPNAEASINPLNPNFYKTTLPRAAGSMVPFLASSAIGGAAGLPARMVAGLSGAAMEVPEMYQRAKALGATPEQLAKAVDTGTLAGLLESLGAESLMGKIGMKGNSIPGHLAKEAIPEAVQEAGQSVIEDLGAKYYSKTEPNLSGKQILKNAAENAVPALFLGAGGGLAGVGGRGRENAAIRAERAPMQGIQPTAAPGPTNIIPLTPKPTQAAVSEAATPIPAIDQTVPRNAVEPSVPPVAAESQSSAFPKLPEVEGVNSREASLFGLKSPVETRVNTALETADKLLNSQSESDQRQGKRMLRQSLADIQKSEGYQAELGLPDDAPKPYTAVRQAIEDRLKPAAKVAEQVAPVPESSAAQPGNTGQRLIEQTRQKADTAIGEGRYDDAVSELKAHQQALKDAKTAARKSPGMRTQIERQIGQVGNQIGEVRRMAREARKQANAPTTGLPKTPTFSQQKAPQAQAEQADTRNISAPLLRPEAVQNPEGGIPEMPEQTFSGRLDQGIRKQDAQKPSAPAKRLISRIQELGGISNRYGGELQGVKDAQRIGVVRNKATMSPDILARQLQSEGYDVDPENLDTLWRAIDRDISTKNERPANTADLNQRLKDEEAEYYAQQEEATNEPTKSFDQIDAEVRGDSDTAALRRSIARSEERGHVMPEAGRGLVSMSPYADLKARNAEVVDRLYEVGPATKEGREIINGLRKFTQQNGIENRHLGNLINDVKNHQMDRAFWKEQGLSLDTVQDGADSEATLKDRVREATAKLPENQRTAIEREVAALDELFGDSDAMNLLDRITEGDNNATNEFKQKAGEYGLEADTVAELIGTRRNARSVRQAEASKTVRQNAGAQTSAPQSREPRSATPDEFDLLNRNPATLTKDEFDEHLLAVEKLRNDEIRGIVKLPRDDRRQMYKHLRNLNDERKFRVQQKELPAKYKKLPVPTMEERRAQWAAEENAEGKASEPVPAPPLNVIGYNQTTDAISSPDGTIYATVRQVKKRNGATAYEVLGYSKLKGKYPDIEGIFDARTKADAIESAKEIARRTISQNAPRIAERKDAAPFTGRYTVKDLAANATAEYRPARNRPGTVYLNDWGHALLGDTLVQVYGERLSGISGDFTISAENARTMAESLNERASEFAPVAKALEQAAADADANGRDVAIVTHRPGQAISRTKVNVRHETTHAAQSAIDKDVTGAATDLWLDRQPKAKQIREELTARGYTDSSHGFEAVAFVASGEYGAFGMTLDEATGLLDSYYRATVRKYGASALEKFGAIDPKLQPTLEGAKDEAGIRRTNTEGQTEVTGRSDRSATIRARREGQGDSGGDESTASGRQGRTAETPQVSRKTREDVENSPEFKRWFGNSKVVDEKGKPLVVYHGTTESFDAFDDAAPGTRGTMASSFFGHFFSPDAAEASKYATDITDKKEGANVVPVYLSIKDPYTLQGVDHWNYMTDARKAQSFRKMLEGNGYDGIVIRSGAGDEYVAFSRSQIKSATGNRGTFDPDSPKINERKEKRSSFGSLENEPKGQVLASGFNVQNLFNRKPKEAKTERPIPLPKGFDAQTWARKTYTDAIVNAMSPADRAKYDAAKGEKAKIAAMLSAKVDQALKDSVFDLIDKAATAAKKGDGRGVLEAVRDAKEYASAPATNLEKLSAMRKASMLSRPTTHLRNLLGNTAFQPLEEAARVPGSIADSAMGLITGRRTLKGANPAEMWRSTTVAATEGVQKAKDAMRGLDPEDLEKAFQVKEIKFKNPIIDKAVKFSFRSLNAEDKIFYTYAYDRAIREQAKLTALNERKNGVIDRKGQAERTEKLYSEPTVEMDVNATTAAEVAVFRNKNILSTGIQSARTAMGDKGSFAVDLILPFDKTPTNIIARTLEYTPLGFGIAAGKAAAFGGRTVKEYRAAKKEGTPSRQAIKEAIDKAMTPTQQRSFSLLAGRSVTGTAAPILLGYYLASLGMATGAYDEDDRKENAKRRETNTPPSSIKIGGRWYQVGGLPPLGSLIAMGATLHEEVNKEDADMESIILGTAKGVGQIASDVPLLRSTKDAVEGLTKEGRAGQKVGRIASSFMPGVVSDAGQLTPGLRDPYERQARSDKKVKGLAKFGRDVGGEVAGKIPGLRRLLPIKTDGSGRKIETEWPDPFDPFSSRPAMDSTEQPGIRGERSRAGLSNTELKQKTGEPDAVYKQRVDRVNGWMDTYGQKLIDNPRYKSFSAEEQKAAVELLRRRIGAQQNLVRPNEKSFEPNAVLLGVQKSTREKPKRDARKLWVAPPR